ncbi:MAG: hypothetical protein WAM98_19425 [Terriglobales bacterium]
MGKQSRRPSKADIREAKVIALADLMRLQDQAGTMEISRDYFRANSTIGDGWNRYWCSFKAFLAAASEDNDLYYAALVEFVDATVTTTKASEE